ncbi:hypothetical protein Cadr_000019952 [Camelus dromedarius]|uniref:Uncharacterized protein n=1 Tax=Camelus dromedarius TaxID=9838 RepID=A0A5N4D3Q6_CAMDR|nr:hypothetical protein Cadr_000019952 [Camelus dromedarius]
MLLDGAGSGAHPWVGAAGSGCRDTGLRRASTSQTGSPSPERRGPVAGGTGGRTGDRPASLEGQAGWAALTCQASSSSSRRRGMPLGSGLPRLAGVAPSGQGGPRVRTLLWGLLSGREAGSEEAWLDAIVTSRVSCSPKTTPLNLQVLLMKWGPQKVWPVPGGPAQGLELAFTDCGCLSGGPDTPGPLLSVLVAATILLVPKLSQSGEVSWVSSPQAGEGQRAVQEPLSQQVKSTGPVARGGQGRGSGLWLWGQGWGSGMRAGWGGAGRQGIKFSPAPRPCSWMRAEDETARIAGAHAYAWWPGQAWLGLSFPIRKVGVHLADFLGLLEANEPRCTEGGQGHTWGSLPSSEGSAKEREGWVPWGPIFTAPPRPFSLPTLTPESLKIHSSSSALVDHRLGTPAGGTLSPRSLGYKRLRVVRRGVLYAFQGSAGKGSSRPFSELGVGRAWGCGGILCCARLRHEAGPTGKADIVGPSSALPLEGRDRLLCPGSLSTVGDTEIPEATCTHWRGQQGSCFHLITLLAQASRAGGGGELLARDQAFSFPGPGPSWPKLSPQIAQGWREIPARWSQHRGQRPCLPPVPSSPLLPSPPPPPQGLGWHVFCPLPGRTHLSWVLRAQLFAQFPPGCRPGAGGGALRDGWVAHGPGEAGTGHPSSSQDLTSEGEGVGVFCETRASSRRSRPQRGIRGHRLLTKPDSCVLPPRSGGRAGLAVGQGATAPPTLIPHYRMENSPADAGAQTSGVSQSVSQSKSGNRGRCRGGSSQGSDPPAPRVKVPSVSRAGWVLKPLGPSGETGVTRILLGSFGEQEPAGGKQDCPGPHASGGVSAWGAGGKIRREDSDSRTEPWRPQTPPPLSWERAPREGEDGGNAETPSLPDSARPGGPSEPEGRILGLGTRRPTEVRGATARARERPPATGVRAGQSRAPAFGPGPRPPGCPCRVGSGTCSPRALAAAPRSPPSSARSGPGRRPLVSPSGSGSAPAPRKLSGATLGGGGGGGGGTGAARGAAAAEGPPPALCAPRSSRRAAGSDSGPRSPCRGPHPRLCAGHLRLRPRRLLPHGPRPIAPALGTRRGQEPGMDRWGAQRARGRGWGLRLRTPSPSALLSQVPRQLLGRLTTPRLPAPWFRSDPSTAPEQAGLESGAKALHWLSRGQAGKKDPRGAPLTLGSACPGSSPLIPLQHPSPNTSTRPSCPLLAGTPTAPPPKGLLQGTHHQEDILASHATSEASVSAPVLGPLLFLTCHLSPLNRHTLAVLAQPPVTSGSPNPVDTLGPHLSRPFNFPGHTWSSTPSGKFSHGYGFQAGTPTTSSLQRVPSVPPPHAQGPTGSLSPDPLPPPGRTSPAHPPARHLAGFLRSPGHHHMLIHPVAFLWNPSGPPFRCQPPSGPPSPWGALPSPLEQSCSWPQGPRDAPGKPPHACPCHCREAPEKPPFLPGLLKPCPQSSLSVLVSAQAGGKGQRQMSEAKVRRLSVQVLGEGSLRGWCPKTPIPPLLPSPAPLLQLSPHLSGREAAPIWVGACDSPRGTGTALGGCEDRRDAPGSSCRWGGSGQLGGSSRLCHLQKGPSLSGPCFPEDVWVGVGTGRLSWVPGWKRCDRTHMECLKCVENIPEMGRNRWGGGPSLRWAPSVYIKGWPPHGAQDTCGPKKGPVHHRVPRGPDGGGTPWKAGPGEGAAVCLLLPQGTGVLSACLTSRAQFRHLIECCELVLPMRPGVCLPACLPAAQVLVGDDRLSGAGQNPRAEGPGVGEGAPGPRNCGAAGKEAGVAVGITGPVYYANQKRVQPKAHGMGTKLHPGASLGHRRDREPAEERTREETASGGQEKAAETLSPLGSPRTGKDKAPMRPTSESRRRTRKSPSERKNKHLRDRNRGREDERWWRVSVEGLVLEGQRFQKEPEDQGLGLPPTRPILRSSRAEPPSTERGAIHTNQDLHPFLQRTFMSPLFVPGAVLGAGTRKAADASVETEDPAGGSPGGGTTAGGGGGERVETVALWGLFLFLAHPAPHAAHCPALGVSTPVTRLWQACSQGTALMIYLPAAALLLNIVLWGWVHADWMALVPARPCGVSFLSRRRAGFLLPLPFGGLGPGGWGGGRTGGGRRREHAGGAPPLLASAGLDSTRGRDLKTLQEASLPAGLFSRVSSCWHRSWHPGASCVAPGELPLPGPPLLPHLPPGAHRPLQVSGWVGSIGGARMHWGLPRGAARHPTKARLLEAPVAACVCPLHTPQVPLGAGDEGAGAHLAFLSEPHPRWLASFPPDLPAPPLPGLDFYYKRNMCRWASPAFPGPATVVPAARWPEPLSKAHTCPNPLLLFGLHLGLLCLLDAHSPPEARGHPLRTPLRPLSAASRLSEVLVSGGPGLGEARPPVTVPATVAPKSRQLLGLPGPVRTHCPPPGSVSSAPGFMQLPCGRGPGSPPPTCPLNPPNKWLVMGVGPFQRRKQRNPSLPEDPQPRWRSPCDDPHFTDGEPEALEVSPQSLSGERPGRVQQGWAKGAAPSPCRIVLSLSDPTPGDAWLPFAPSHHQGGYAWQSHIGCHPAWLDQIKPFRGMVAARRGWGQARSVTRQRGWGPGSTAQEAGEAGDRWCLGTGGQDRKRPLTREAWLPPSGPSDWDVQPRQGGSGGGMPGQVDGVTKRLEKVRRGPAGPGDLVRTGEATKGIRLAQKHQHVRLVLASSRHLCPYRLWSARRVHTRPGQPPWTSFAPSLCHHSPRRPRSPPVLFHGQRWAILQGVVRGRRAPAGPLRRGNRGPGRGWVELGWGCGELGDHSACRKQGGLGVFLQENQQLTEDSKESPRGRHTLRSLRAGHTAPPSGPEQDGAMIFGNQCGKGRPFATFFLPVRTCRRGLHEGVGAAGGPGAAWRGPHGEQAAGSRGRRCLAFIPPNGQGWAPEPGLRWLHSGEGRPLGSLPSCTEGPSWPSDQVSQGAIGPPAGSGLIEAETGTQALKTLDVESPRDPAVPLGVSPEDTTAGTPTATCVSVFTASLFTAAESWRHPVCPPMDERIDKVTLLSDVSPSPKDKSCRIPLLSGTQRCQVHRDRRVGAMGRGRFDGDGRSPLEMAFGQQRECA